MRFSFVQIYGSTDESDQKKLLPLHWFRENRFDLIKERVEEGVLRFLSVEYTIRQNLLESIKQVEKTPSRGSIFVQVEPQFTWMPVPAERTLGWTVWADLAFMLPYK
jgi:hypothetical protein